MDVLRQYVLPMKTVVTFELKSLLVNSILVAKTVFPQKHIPGGDQVGLTRCWKRMLSVRFCCSKSSTLVFNCISPRIYHAGKKLSSLIER